MCRRKSVCLFFILIVGLACKKISSVKDQEEIISPITGTRTEFTLDSIFLYAKQIYLWNDVLPEYEVFSPRIKYVNIKSDFTAFKQELFDISQLKINLTTTKPFEFSLDGKAKYSYLGIGRSVSGLSKGGSIVGGAILADNIIESEGRKIAYLALGSFPKLNSCKDKLDLLFSDFADAKPNYIIVDLRSNGGGYVETAEYIANLIAPSTLNGKLMYAEEYNSTLQNGKATILKYQPYLDSEGKPVIYKGRNATLADVDYTLSSNSYNFAKKGRLESIQQVYFIVSGKTASASELLISALKPYFDIKLIGEKTYGKPVGFFGINIEQYSIYLSSFLIKNATGWHDYFEGMQPDVSVSTLNQFELGNVEEPCLKMALSLINGGKKIALKKDNLFQSTDARNTKSNQLLIEKGLMIENRLKLKR